MFSPLREWCGRPEQEAVWRARVEADPDAPIEMHPSLVLQAQLDEDGSFVWAPPSREEGRLAPFALLAAKTVSVAVGPRPLPPARLRGHYLLSGHIAGQPKSNVCVEFVSAALELLKRGQTDFLLFEELDTGGAPWAAIHRAHDGVKVLHGAPEEAHWLAVLPEEGTAGEAYWQKQFSGKTRATLRRKIKKLDGRLVCYRTLEDVPLFLEAAKRVSANSWQLLRLGRGIRGERGDRARLEALAKLGALRSYVLQQGDRPLASLLGHQWNGRFEYASPAFDQIYAGLSPGIVLLCQVMEHLLAVDRPKLVDFGPGLHEYKRQFGNQRRADRTLYVVRPGSASARVLALDHFRRRARSELHRRAKDLLQRSGLWNRLRSRYRRSGVRELDTE